MGDWIQPEPGANGKLISSLNMSGTWPYIDLCRRYAAIIMVKSPESEPKKEIYLQFRQALESIFGSGCQ